jgi:hypothetical protein
MSPSPLASSHPAHAPRFCPWKAALLGGLVAGSVDLGSAALIYHRSLGFICRSIASGLWGAAAFQPGRSGAVLGLALQWAMSIVIAAIYWAATLPVPVLRRRWIVGGTIAGGVTFAVMNYVVIPLSAIHRVPHFTPTKFAENLVAMFLFGWLIAFFCRPSSRSS